MRLSFGPVRIAPEPGAPVTFSVTVTTAGDYSAGIRASQFGVPPAPPVPEPGVVSTCVTGTLLVEKVPAMLLLAALHTLSCPFTGVASAARPRAR